MILLYGRSPSGKTTYFRELFNGRETRIIHASDINELRKAIISVQSPLNENEPTLINTWFDLAEPPEDSIRDCRSEGGGSSWLLLLHILTAMVFIASASKP